MKFSSLQHTSVKTFSVPRLDGGTDLSLPPDTISDSALSDGVNIWFDKGILKTRPGLLSDSGKVIMSESSTYDDTLNYSLTDAGFFSDGEYKRIAVGEYCESGAHYFCRIFLISADGSSSQAGYLLFNRVSNDEFNIPENILFYSAEAVSGAGVFAFVTTHNIYNTQQKGYRIYELSADMQSWSEHISYYTPVVYINGRGTRYEQSRSLGIAYTGTPKVIESENILTNRFKAYYTSDAYSSTFRLPFSGLDSDSVICRVYYEPADYCEWVIPQGQNNVTATFYTAQITLNIDREKGIFYFTGEEGEYPVPKMSKYPENNISITAGKNTGFDIGSAVSCTCTADCGSRLLFSGGRDKGRVFSVPRSNPLYFPADSCFDAGGNDSGINALVPCSDGVAAFKQNEIYLLKIKEGGKINTTSLLADDSSTFYNADSFTVKRISADTGCAAKETCAVYADRPVWLGSDKAVYSLNVSSNKISKLSSPVGDFLRTKTEEKAYAAIYGNHYILISGSKAVIIDCGSDAESPVCYIWNFGEISPVGVFVNSGEICFLCVSLGGMAMYSAGLGGNTDTLVSEGEDGLIFEDFSFYSRAVTKHYRLGNIGKGKHIQSIFLAFESDGQTEIVLNGNMLHGDITENGGGLKTLKLIPEMPSVNKMSLEISSSGSFSAGGFTVYYRESV